MNFTKIRMKFTKIRMKFTKIKIIHKNKYEIHKNRTLSKKPGHTPVYKTMSTKNNLIINFNSNLFT